MFIGKLALNGNFPVLQTIDGEELFLAHKGKIEPIPDNELDWAALEFHSMPIQRYLGIRIGNILNIVRRDPPGFFVREKIGPAVMNMRGVLRGDKSVIVE